MVRHSAMVQQAFIMSLTLSFGYVLGQDVVNLGENCEIHGTLMTTRKGRNISAYLGLPYAEPPIGRLRFRNPVEWKLQAGVIKGDTYPNPCPQVDGNGFVIGDEDCLYLNVYTPKIPDDDAYPVMVYFHGGDFMTGSSAEAGPEYLLDRDIVLVTVNYRLGVLGFLSTGDAGAPGNFGLKDQVVALQWIRTYILGFGGHFKKVTIFGQDAGGASTSYLAMSRSSRGLFDQYISQSGSPMAYWSFANHLQDDYKQNAKYLGKYLKCSTKTSWDLVKCLRTLNVSTLVNTNNIFSARKKYLGQIWVPTTEPKGLPGTFMTIGPGESAVFYWQDWIKDCPAMMGTVSDEGLAFTAGFFANSTMYDVITGNIDNFLTYLLDMMTGDKHSEQNAQKVKDAYFESIDLTDKKAFSLAMADLLTDSAFAFPVTFQNWMMMDILTPFYVYKFDYRGSYSKTSDVIGNNDNLGPSHGDDLTYLFPLKNSTIKLSESDEKMIDIMLDLWTSFAYNGVPTSQLIPEPNIWEPFRRTMQSLVIGEGSDPLAMSFEEPLESNSFLFWAGISVFQIFGEMAIPAP